MINKIKTKLSKDIHLKELLKGSSIAFVFKIIGMGLGYIFTLLIARWYGAETIGLYALSLTVLNIFVTIGVFGFDNALVKFVAEYNSNDKSHLVKEVYTKVLYITIPLGFLLSAILYFNADFFAETIFKKEQLTLFLQITSFAILPFVLLRINATLFQGLKQIKLFSFYGGLGVAFFSLIGLVIVSSLFEELDNSIVIIVQTLSIALVMLISFINVKKNKNIIKTMSKHMLKYKNILKVSLPMLLTSSMTLVMGWTDIIMLGMFRSEAEVGVYSVVVKLAGLTSITLIAINSIAAPKFSEFYSNGDIEGLKNIAQNSTKMIFVSSLPIIIVLMLFPKLILGMFGSEFIVGITALLILMFGQLISMLSGSVAQILNMTGKQFVLQATAIVSTVINLILNLLLIPEFGISGAAFATASSLALWNILCVIYIKYKFNFYTIFIPKINLTRTKNV